MDVTPERRARRPGARGGHQDPPGLADATCTTSRRSASSTSTSSRPTQGRPYAEAGDTFKGDAASLPESTDDLLIEIELAWSARWTGTSCRRWSPSSARCFEARRTRSQRMVDSGTTFVEAAKANQQRDDRPARHRADRAARPSGRTRTTSGRSPATWPTSPPASRTGDKDLRAVLEGGTPALDEVRLAAPGHRADPAGVHRQPGHREPGRHRQAAARSSRPWSPSRAVIAVGVHRHAG